MCLAGGVGGGGGSLWGLGRDYRAPTESVWRVVLVVVVLINVPPLRALRCGRLPSVLVVVVLVVVVVVVVVVVLKMPPPPQKFTNVNAHPPPQVTIVNVVKGVGVYKCTHPPP